MTTTFIVSSLLLFAVLVFLIFWYFLSPDVRYNKNEAEQQKKAGQYDCSNTNVPVFNFKVLDIETDDYGTEYMKSYISSNVTFITMMIYPGNICFHVFRTIVISFYI